MGFRRDAVHDFQLTDAELEIANRIDNVDLKQILRREGSGIGSHTQAFLKLAARVRAERLLHQELVLLRDVKGQLASLQTAEATIREQIKQINVLQRELDRTKADYVKELAAPAMAVHAEPTGR